MESGDQNSNAFPGRINNAELFEGMVSSALFLLFEASSLPFR